MSDQEFADWLRSVPREVSPEEVERLERLHDLARGHWHNRNEVPCYYGEAAH